MIETGSNPYFLLCAQNTSALKENEELSKYYSIAYDIWMKNENTVDEFNIVDIYNKINEAMSDVQYAEYVKFENLLGERVIGEEELAEAKTFSTFEGEVETQNTYVYKTDYYLGDIVQIKNEFDIERAARIVEVVESYNDEGYSFIPTFEYAREV
jgi:hypothetical protein